MTTKAQPEMQRMAIQVTTKQAEALWERHAKTKKSVAAIVRDIIDAEERQILALKLARNVIKLMASGSAEAKAKVDWTGVLGAMDQALGEK